MKIINFAFFLVLIFFHENGRSSMYSLCDESMVEKGEGDYLDKNSIESAIVFLKKNHINSNKINWDVVENDIRSRCDKKSNAYLEINNILHKLGGRHSAIVSKEVVDLVNVEGKHLDSYGQQNLKPLGFRFGSVGYLKVPGFKFIRHDFMVEFAKDIQNEILELNKFNIRSWVLDFRGNNGGNIWPMILGLGLLTENDVQLLLEDKKSLKYVIYKNNEVFLSGDASIGLYEKVINFNFLVDYDIDSKPIHKVYRMLKLPEVKISMKKNMPIAVLIDHTTASSGEGLSIVFKQRPNTRFFGSRTAGLTTNTLATTLPNGSLIVAPVGYMRDVSGQKYESGIFPDQFDDDSNFLNGKELINNDATLTSALFWLNLKISSN